MTEMPLAEHNNVVWRGLDAEFSCRPTGSSEGFSSFKIRPT
jgi:hypothetical protein